MTAPDPKWVEAGARALAAVRRDMNPVEVASDRRRREAAALLTAVEPLIREQIATQIEELADDWSDWSALVQAHEDLLELRDVVKDAVHDAAAIARTGGAR